MYQSYLVPISVKGIVFENDKVWLRFNERHEWELPGGKMDEGEQPEETLVREMREELGVMVKPIRPVDAHLYTIHVSMDESRGVLVLSYLCELVERVGEVEHVGEAGKAKFQTFHLHEIMNLSMPSFYKTAIQKASEFFLS